MQAGYSGTPLPKKLGIKPGSRVRLLNAPAGFSLHDLPEGTSLSESDFDVAVAFCTRVAEIEEAINILRPNMAIDGGIWLAWPKKSSGVPSECHDGNVRTIGLSTGLVDNKVCAINEVWSALRFVIRVKDR
ncbi:MAG: DUF3052 domain-containing protein [Fimbriimonadaceae bacterium]